MAMMKNVVRRMVAILLCGALCSMVAMPTLASPARRIVQQVQQPDGTTLTLTRGGDRLLHGWYTQEGVPVVKGEDGCYYYALMQEGALKCSTVLAHDAEEQTEEEKVWLASFPWKEYQREVKRTRALRMSRDNGIPDYRIAKFPTIGEHRGLVLMVEFSDVSFYGNIQEKKQQLWNRLNEDNYTEHVEYKGYSQIHRDSLRLRADIPGSARDYFIEQSGGKFLPSFDVVGPVKLDKPRVYYGGNTAQGTDGRAREMVADACTKAYELNMLDWSKYDNDGDGIVDYVYVIFAGSDEALVPIGDCIWAHKGLLDNVKLGKHRIQTYACSGAILDDFEDLPLGLGLFIHEFSHILGLPDFYNVFNPKQFMMDAWSVMDYGHFNRACFVPCAYTAFERYSLGWLPMQTLDAPCQIAMGTVSEAGTGYRAFAQDGDTTSFFVYENIRKEGWNRYAPGQGLLITQVNYHPHLWVNNQVNTGDKRYAVMPANNLYRGGASLKGQLYGPENHAFTSTSLPSSTTSLGVVMDKPLTDILLGEDGQVSFRFRGGTDGVEEVTDCPRSWRLNGRELRMTIGEGQKYHIYAPDGTVYALGVSTGDEIRVILPSKGLFLVTLGDNSFKVACKN